jgi:Glycosyl hydrolase family 26
VTKFINLIRATRCDPQKKSRSDFGSDWSCLGISRRSIGRSIILVFVIIACALPACSRSVAYRNEHLSGAFLGSDVGGIRALPKFGNWRGTGEPLVGHTYLPGRVWEDIRGPTWLLTPWSSWRAGDPARVLVINAPMLVPNEGNLSDSAVRALLYRGSKGDFDGNFEVLAHRLIAYKVPDAIIVLGWEMNGSVYTSRCGPDPEEWKTYWRRIVDAMRAVKGSRFRFDFAPSRGTDDAPWPECYPGDNYVDIIGMDTYDQPPGRTFDDFVQLPFGLAEQARFASQHGKPISFPEWGLSQYGDDPNFVIRMHEWINNHDVMYETITDYCPHGVWRCTSNQKSSAAYRSVFGNDLQQVKPR